MEAEVSLLHSQELATCPWSEPDQSSLGPSPPYAPHALPISFFSILSPA